MSDIVNKLELIPPKTLPDHSILSSTFVSSFYDLAKNYGKQNCNQNKKDVPDIPPKPHKKVKKNISKIDQSFFLSEDTFQLILSTINKLEIIANTKAEIDQLWLEVKNVILAEMSSLPELPSSSFKKQNRKFKKSNKFWNDELETLWLESCKAKNKYMNFKVHSNVDLPIKNNFSYFLKLLKNTLIKSLDISNESSRRTNIWNWKILQNLVQLTCGRN